MSTLVWIVIAYIFGALTGSVAWSLIKLLWAKEAPKAEAEAKKVV